MLPEKMTTESDRIKRAAERLAALVKRYEQEMDTEVPMGINPPEEVVIGGISEYDGTAGWNNKPDFVRRDDEEWN
jgi:hypothetical protein